jgi:hypothetical protein
MNRKLISLPPTIFMIKNVLKPADKGGAIVIWSTTDYEKEALSQLNDNKYYEYVPANSTTVIATQKSLCQKSFQIWRH